MDDSETSKLITNFNADSIIKNKNIMMLSPEEKTILSIETQLKNTKISEPSNSVIDVFEHPYMNFPFLTSIDTISWIKSNLVMFIMRGLPGSGKSTVVKSIKSIYGNDDSGEFVICSADQYFMKNETYQFDISKLKDAHSYCQNKAQDAAKSKISTIVIDNTNVMKWEIGPYIKMGKSEGYIILLVEPKTPWLLDVDILTEKNKHGVSKDILNKKVQMYMPIIPAYFGWFLCATDSEKLLSGSKKLLQSCLKRCDKFRLEFGDLLLSLRSTPHRSEYFKYPNAKNSNKHVNLHCTAKYCGKPKNGKYSQNILT